MQIAGNALQAVVFFARRIVQKQCLYVGNRFPGAGERGSKTCGLRAIEQLCDGIERLPDGTSAWQRQFRQIAVQIDHRIAEFEHREQPLHRLALQCGLVGDERVDLREQIARAAFEVRRQALETSVTRMQHFAP